MPIFNLPDFPNIENENIRPKIFSDSRWIGRRVVIIVATFFTFSFGLMYHVAIKVMDTFQGINVNKRAHFESIIQAKFNDDGNTEILDILHKIKIRRPLKLLRNLSEADENELKMLKFLKNNYVLTPAILEEILKGAHIWLPDNGEAYRTWKMLKEASPRKSSHPSDDEQYSIQGPLVRELLFSTISPKSFLGISAKKFTWFQLESYPVHTLKNIFFHGCTYITYLIINKNIGPHGNSRHTDKHPLILKRKIKIG